MEMATVTFTLEKSLKQEIENSLTQLGLTWNEFFQQSLIRNIPNAETIMAINKIESGEDKGKVYGSMAEFWAELEEEDADT